MSVGYTPADIREIYDRAAMCYERGELPLEWLALDYLRRKLLQRARGRVLEVAAGTGCNLLFYPPGCSITAVDLSSGMLKIARQRAEKLGLNITFIQADAEQLPFGAGAFDTVVSTLSTCTFPHPVRALNEMSRVCRPDGLVLLLEHGRASTPFLNRWMGHFEPVYARSLGCHWNRDTHSLVKESNLIPIHQRRDGLGMLYTFVARPRGE